MFSSNTPPASAFLIHVVFHPNCSTFLILRFVQNALEDHEAVNVNPIERAPSSENLILNELIREYLEYNGFLNTLSVFHPETGQPRTPTGRIGREVLVSFIFKKSATLFLFSSTLVELFFIFNFFE